MTPQHELHPVAEAMAHFTMSANYHVGGSLSPVDFLTALYFGGSHRLDVTWRARPDRDKYVHSKGHTAAGQWFALWLHGYLGDMPLDELVTFGSFGHRLPRIPQRDVEAGIEMTTGSLGQGLSYGNGLALADRRAGRDAHTVVLLGDAECGEGQVWEAAQSTVRLGLANVTVAVDANGFGSHLDTDRDRLPAMWAGFGWAVTEVDGHDLAGLGAALGAARGSGRPTAVVLRTEKAHRLLPPYPGTFRAGGSVPPEYRPAYDLPAECAAAAEVVASRYPAAAGARERPRPAAGPAARAAAAPLTWDPGRHRGGDVVGTKSFALELAEHVPPGGDLFIASPDAIRNSGLMPLLAGHGSWTWENPRSAVLEHPIAEADLASTAAGATANGLRTVVFLMEGFVWRMLDSLRQSICFPGLPVVVVGTSAGVGEDLGPMAQSDACLAAVTALPGLAVFEACDVNEAKVLLDEALAEPGPAYLRLPTEALPVSADLAEVRARDSRDGAWVLRAHPDPDLVLVSAGSLVPTVLATASRLAAEGVGVRVVSVCSTTRLARAPAYRRDVILPPGVPTVSVHNAPPSVLAALLPAGSTSLGLTDYGGYGGPPERLYEAAGLGPAQVLAAARQALAAAPVPRRPVGAGVGDDG